MHWFWNWRSKHLIYFLANIQCILVRVTCRVTATHEYSSQGSLIPGWFSVWLLKLAVSRFQDCLAALLALLLLYEYCGSTVDKRVPDAAWAAGGPHLRNACHNCTVCFRFCYGSIVFWVYANSWDFLWHVDTAGFNCDNLKHYFQTCLEKYGNR